jgi:hypothetical protein
MKKIAFIFCVFLIGIALVVPANAQPLTGTWDSRNGDFAAGTWKELLWGGAEGAPGNEIQAEGDCYVFEGALLETVELMSTHSGTTPFIEYLTFYGNGTLNLTNEESCPWHNDEDPYASFIAELTKTIVVTKKYYESDDYLEPTGEISFILTSFGEFPDYEDYKVEVIAYYRGEPTFDELGNPVAFMTDDLEFAKIIITGPDAPATVDVPVDIKPGSCPNPINVRSRGVLPVAVLGTADFDVTTILPDSIQLNGVSPIRWAMEDVATPDEPFIGKLDAYDCNELGPDGYIDLALKFNKQEIVNTFGDVEDRDVIILQLTGELEDGTLINGEDVIIVIKPKLVMHQAGN